MKNKTKNQLAVISVMSVLGWMFLTAYFRYQHVSPEGDVGCFSAIAHQLLNGSVLYKDVFDNKAPGIFFLHAISKILMGIFQSIIGERLTETQLLQLWGLATCLFSVGIIGIAKFKVSPIISTLNLLIFCFGFIGVISYWPAMFVGGYTEEIGSYFLLSSIGLIYLSKSLPQNKSTILWSGLLAGIAVWIKEPFVLLIPALIPFLLRQNNRQNILWLFCFFLPWLFYGLYCTVTGSWTNYFQYLQFATDYAAINSSDSSNIFQSINHQLSPPNQQLYPITQSLLQLVFVVFSISLFILLIGKSLNKSEWKPTGFSRTNNLTKPTVLKWIQQFISSNSSNNNLILGLLSMFLLLIGSFYFSQLGGKNAFPHYQLPWMFSIVFATWMTLNFLIDYIEIWKPQISIFNRAFFPLPILICSILVWIFPNAKENFQTIRQQNFPPFQNKKTELDQWSKQLPLHVFNSIQNTSLYIDDPQSGRFYSYFNSQNSIPFPCPYFVYFYSPNTSTDTTINNRLQRIFYSNQQRQLSYFQSDSPQFIITGNNSGFIQLNEEINHWFKGSYVKIHEVDYHNFKYKLYQYK